MTITPASRNRKFERLFRKKNGKLSWPRIVIAGFAALVVIGALTSGSKSAKSSAPTPSTTLPSTATTNTNSTTTATKTVTKLTQERAVRLPADGAAWESALHKYLTVAPGCFGDTGGQFRSCLQAAYQKWAAPFAKAERDVVLDAHTVTGKCRSRLLDYAGTGSTGDALRTTMGFVQKDALTRNLPLLKTTLNELLLPAFKTVNQALIAAELAC
jgi:hypothetical protein